ncbi:MAG: Tetratricopeptide repeat protein [Verrucomicrobia bacterium ADurb.Bin345]|nr:MAG: Tetratricopeptide repeat protein [Verrucomicrobia bacterium ADurb.Bin345]
MKQPAFIHRSAAALRYAIALSAAATYLLSACPPTWADNADSGIPAAKQEQLFHDAARAYDQGQFGQATSLYRQLISSGHVSEEALFNLGNSLFRGGQIGQAVLNYRRAQYLDPRDPDILANLRFALQTTGAAPPQYGSLMTMLLRFSRAEWVVAATTAYWLAAVCVALILILRSGFRDMLGRWLILLGALLVIALSGIAAWAQLGRRPELVVIKPQQQALFAPLEQNATPHFALAEGSIVRAVEFSGSWVKIVSADREGWIKLDVCEPVCISSES